MFYTSNSIRITSRCLEYLFLMQKANNRHEENRSKLARYDATNSPYDYVRLFNNRNAIVTQLERYEKLGNWLLKRYLQVKTDLDRETFRSTSRSLSHLELEKLQ